MRRFFLFLLILIVALAVVLLFNTLRFRRRQLTVSPVPPVAVNEPAAVDRLAQAIRFQTTSLEDRAKISYEQFSNLRDHLQNSYPAVHSNLQREVIGHHSLLYIWRGSDRGLKPFLLMGHLDVVPADPKGWTHPPFSGAIADGYVWGRGTLDDKENVMAILEAVEWLLARNITPGRDIYFAFGHDEEIGGVDGAARIAKALQARNVPLDFVLDEGLVILKDSLPDIRSPIATIAIAEKGYVTLQLTLAGEGGHSSLPPKHTAVGEMSRAIQELEDHPFDANLNPTTRAMLAYLGPEMPYTRRILLANLWLFGPLVKTLLLRIPETAAMLRTTTAATVIHGGIKENVLPSSVTALVNFSGLRKVIRSGMSSIMFATRFGTIAFRFPFTMASEQNLLRFRR